MSLKKPCRTCSDKVPLVIDAEPDDTKAKANEDVVIYILYYRWLVGKMNWYVVLKLSPFP